MQGQVNTVPEEALLPRHTHGVLASLQAEDLHIQSLYSAWDGRKTFIPETAPSAAPQPAPGTDTE